MDISLEALKLRERELELDAVMIRGRIEEIRSMIAVVQHRRGGRPRKSAEVSIIPQRVPGAEHQTETDEQLFPEDAA